MGTIPLVPTLEAGYAAQGAQLQELCTAITWLMTGKPLAELNQGSAQTFTSGTAAALTWDTKVTDRDSGWSSGSNTRYTAQTPGYYLAEAVASFNGASSGGVAAWYQVTTGSGNPVGAGVNTLFCRPALPLQSAGTAVALKSLTPYMYAGDYIQVIAEQTSGGTLSTATAPPSHPQCWFTIMLASG
jgi:hypothetical protein